MTQAMGNISYASDGWFRKAVKYHKEGYQIKASVDSPVSRRCITSFLCFKCFTVYVWTEKCCFVADVPWHSGIMPRADTCLSVEKVHLALLRGPLLCRET